MNREKIIIGVCVLAFLCTVAYSIVYPQPLDPRYDYYYVGHGKLIHFLKAGADSIPLR